MGGTQPQYVYRHMVLGNMETEFMVGLKRGATVVWWSCAEESESGPHNGATTLELTATVVP